MSHAGLLLADVSDRLTEAFFALDQGQWFVLLMVAIGCAIPIILGLAGIIYSAVDSVHRRRLETELKRELVERGMTAEEIVRIVEATSPEGAAPSESNDSKSR
jgi:hypothetical protein